MSLGLHLVSSFFLQQSLALPRNKNMCQLIAFRQLLHRSVPHLVVIVDRPLAPMLGRRKDKGDVGVGGGDVSAVPPVQLHHVLTAHLAHPRGKALGHEPAQAVIEPDVGTQRRTSRALLHVETRGVNICHHQFAFSISGTQRRSLRRLCVEIVFVDLSDNAVEKDISSCGISRLQLNSRKLKGPIKA